MVTEKFGYKGLIGSIILIVLGALFCCSLAMGINGLSIVLGIVLIFCGAVFISVCIIDKEQIFSPSYMLGIILLSLGVVFIIYKLAGIVFLFIPWFLIVFGALIVVNVLIAKKDNILSNTSFTINLIIGILLAGLGILLNLIDGFMEYASIALGILMILYGIYLLCIVIKKNN